MPGLVVPSLLTVNTIAKTHLTFFVFNLSPQKTRPDTCANSIVPDDKPSRQDLHCHNALFLTDIPIRNNEHIQIQ